MKQLCIIDARVDREKKKSKVKKAVTTNCDLKSETKQAEIPGLPMKSPFGKGSVRIFAQGPPAEQPRKKDGGHTAHG